MWDEPKAMPSHMVYLTAHELALLASEPKNGTSVTSEVMLKTKIPQMTDWETYRCN